MQFWILANSLQLFLFAADTHSMLFEGHLDTLETVDMDKGHHIQTVDYITNKKSKTTNKRCNAKQIFREIKFSKYLLLEELNNQR